MVPPRGLVADGLEGQESSVDWRTRRGTRLGTRLVGGMEVVAGMRAWTAGALAATLLLAGCALPFGGSRRLPLGVDVGWVEVGPPAMAQMTAAKARRVRAAGAGLARVEFRSQPFFGTTQAAFDRGYGKVVQNLNAAHVQVLGLLDYTTVGGGQSAWNRGGSSTRTSGGANAYTRHFARTAAAIMRAFRGRVRYWEIWNEPNAWHHNDGGGRYSGGTYMYPNTYAAMLRETYHQAVQVDHLPVTIVSGGLLGGAFGGNYDRANSGAVYLQQVFACWKAQGVHPYPLDAVGQHLYIAQGGVAGSVVTSAQVSEYLRWVHDVPTHYGLPHMPTFLTEVGWSSGQVGGPDKARNLRTALTVASHTPYVHAFVWFNLQSGNGMRYGLNHPNGAPSAADRAYRQLAPIWMRGG